MGPTLIREIGYDARSDFVSSHVFFTLASFTFHASGARPAACRGETMITVRPCWFTTDAFAHWLRWYRFCRIFYVSVVGATVAFALVLYSLSSKTFLLFDRYFAVRIVAQSQGRDVKRNIFDCLVVDGSGRRASL